MNNKELNISLRKDAIGFGLCKQWQADWKSDWDMQTLIDKYKEGIDFCLLNDYPGNEFIKTNFSQDILRENAILVDDKYSLLNQRICVLLGNSNSTIRYNGRNLGAVYVKDNSHCEVIAKGFSFCIIHAFGNSHLKCSAFDKANIVVLKHSKDIEVEKSEGFVRIKEELDYLTNLHLDD